MLVEPFKKAFADVFVDLGQRSDQDELLDAPDIPATDLFQNLAELDTINRYLGGHQLTLNGIAKLIGLPGQAASQREWSILDVGCGGGDSLNAIYHWAQSQGLRFTLTGVDLKEDCIRYAREHAVSKDIHWLVSDYRDLHQPYDIVITSLFCHHLSDSQLLGFFQSLKSVARFGFVINDLQRHALAYYGIQVLTQIFSRSHLVKHDAPLSVWRGFRANELRDLFEQAGLHPQIEWQWAFRYLVYGYV